MLFVKLEQKKLSGITLVETLLYMALFSIMMVSSVQFFLSVNEFNTKATRRNKVERYAIFLDSHFTNTFEKISSIDSANSTFDLSPGVLRLLRSDGTYITYSINANKVSVDDNGVVTTLTPSDIAVSNFLLTPVDNGTGHAGVLIHISYYLVDYPNTTREIQTLYILK